MVTSRDYCTALSILDERGLFEVLGLFQEVLTYLIEEECTYGYVEGWAYTHRLARIYTERVMQLTGVGPGRTRLTEDLAHGVPFRAEGRHQSRRKL